MDHVNVPTPAFRFMENLLELTLFSVLSKIVWARKGVRRVRAAFVGHDNHFLTNLEGAHDSLIDFSDPAESFFEDDPKGDWRLGFNCFEGRAGNEDRPSRPLSSLAPDAFDVVVIADEQPEREAELTQRVADHFTQSGGSWSMIVPFSRLRNAFVATLFNLREGRYFTSLNPRKTAAVAIALYFATGASGCVIECGTYLGGTAILMGSLLRNWGDARAVHTFDTFTGIPPATAPDGQTIFRGGTFKETSYDFVNACIAAHGLSGSVFAHKGLIQERLPQLWEREREVAFCFADTDQYAGTAASLAGVLPRLHPDGLVLVDDYCEHGVRTAVREALQKHPALAGTMVSHSVYLIGPKLRRDD